MSINHTATGLTFTESKSKVKAPYNPQYDPLVDKHPGKGQDYAPTYWIGTAGTPPEDDGPVTGDMNADVVIVGSGYTGLTTAIYLAEHYGIKATVLEANHSSWGCSTRNGGQAQCASGRLKRSQWIERWGLDTALKMHRECVEGMNTFKEMIKDIDCEPQMGGHFYVAHRAKVMPQLEKEAKLLRETFDYDAQIIDRSTFKNTIIGDAEAHGAMLEPEGIGIHAGKLAFGYLEKARALGVKVHTSSPVISLKTQGGKHYLETPHGTVTADSVGLATGGYTSQLLHKTTKNRLLPVLSNSIVTRPLTDLELQECNLHSHQILTDTRVLRHYYRLLPDNRIQIGSRSSITGKHAPRQKFQHLLENSLARKFPTLGGIDIDYSWWGWVDVSHDMMPRIYQPNPSESLFYALGYGGNGVMYSAQAGKRLAQWIAGDKAELDLPIFQSQLPFPNVREVVESELFAPFRRMGQKVLYNWYQLKDEVL